ncbi:MAG: SDR family NAD(P)-dependent oxidoreductase [Myxococcales bacterium]|nr:SDR family NAD(P)-dependent oxidoreductase [Myxococcales bacterium]
MRVQDKVIVVTGGASGIGKALCKRFAQEGARGVVVADLNEKGALAVADRIGGLGMKCDVSVEADLLHVVERTEKHYGPIDLLCSNAGIFFGDGEGGMATSLSNDRWQRMWEVNVRAHIYGARAVLPSMIERGEGYLLQTASAAGLLNQIGDAAYSTTKHAAIGFAESLAITHGDQGIKVSVLCPQGVATPMLDGWESSPQAGDGVLQPEEVAESVIRGLEAERFLILPHPQVRTYMERKVSDYDRWLGGMRRLRRKFSE